MIITNQNEKDIEIILEQWKTCVEMANSVSQRRDAMNNIFITLNLAVVTAISFNFEIKSLFILGAGIIVSIIWILFIRNYKLLNTEKFKVINEIENKLPVKPFNTEWEKLKINKKYRDSTKFFTYNIYNIIHNSNFCNCEIQIIIRRRNTRCYTIYLLVILGLIVMLMKDLLICWMQNHILDIEIILCLKTILYTMHQAHIY